MWSSHLSHRLVLISYKALIKLSVHFIKPTPVPIGCHFGACTKLWITWELWSRLWTTVNELIHTLAYTHLVKLGITLLLKQTACWLGYRRHNEQICYKGYSSRWKQNDQVKAGESEKFFKLLSERQLILKVMPPVKSESSIYRPPVTSDTSRITSTPLNVKASLKTRLWLSPLPRTSLSGRRSHDRQPDSDGS